MKIIFLDIDGVLQPDTQKRFKHDLEALKASFAAQNQEFENLDKYDIGAVYYDWDKTAVELMKKLCAKTGARFVISSDWRMKIASRRRKSWPVIEKDFAAEMAFQKSALRPEAGESFFKNPSQGMH